MCYILLNALCRKFCSVNYYDCNQMQDNCHEIMLGIFNLSIKVFANLRYCDKKKHK